MVSVHLSDKFMYEWFECGEESTDKNNKIFQSVVATMAGIQYSLDNNIARFDFMGAGKPNEEYGVREFKSKFGGEVVENGRFLYLCKAFLYSIAKTILTLIKRFT